MHQKNFRIFKWIFLIIIFLIRLQIPNLGINEMYQKILQNYGYDIEAVCKLYTRQKQDPPLARNLPPIAGKILWARHLFHRIQQPMNSFQQHPAVLQTPDGKRIIHNYNKVARVLMEFEVIYHRGWLQQVKQLILIRIFLLKNMLGFCWRQISPIQLYRPD